MWLRKAEEKIPDYIHKDDLKISYNETYGDYVIYTPWSFDYYVTSIAGFKLGFGARYHLARILRKVFSIYPATIPIWELEWQKVPNVDEPIVRRLGYREICCPNCHRLFDCGKQPKTGMGWLTCPHCGYVLSKQYNGNTWDKVETERRKYWPLDGNKWETMEGTENSYKVINRGLGEQFEITVANNKQWLKKITNFILNNLVVDPNSYYVWDDSLQEKILVRGSYLPNCYRKVVAKLTPEVIKEHLTGTKLIAIPVIRDGFCKNIVFDYDDIFPYTFTQIFERIASDPYCVLPSKDKGKLHVHVLFEEPIDAKTAVNKGREYLDKIINIWEVEEPIKKFKVEVKPDSLDPRWAEPDWHIISLPFYKFTEKQEYYSDFLNQLGGRNAKVT
jgi:hypothetical protein